MRKRDSMHDGVQPQRSRPFLGPLWEPVRFFRSCPPVSSKTAGECMTAQQKHLSEIVTHLNVQTTSCGNVTTGISQRHKVDCDRKAWKQRPSHQIACPAPAAVVADAVTLVVTRVRVTRRGACSTANIKAVNLFGSLKAPPVPSAADFMSAPNLDDGNEDTYQPNLSREYGRCQSSHR